MKDQVMAIQAVRALRGTKTLTQAFFNAADSIALERRPAVVKAALSSIHDELKTAREKAKLAKSKVVRAALPHLRAQGGGRILQLSSMGGQWAMPGLSLYHATKWAMEGFFESTALDIAPFNIETTLVEPGSARTEFAASSAAIGPPMTEYADTPAGAIRRLIEPGYRIQPGDPAKMATAMIASVDQVPAPRRLALGSDAFRNVQAALTERLAALEAQEAIAQSTDFPAA